MTIHFFNPGTLFILGLIPLLIIIHSLKPRPRQVDVTTMFLWQEVMRERKGGFHLHRLMKNLPLLLQILALIFTALALGRPVWFYDTPLRGDVIMVLDTSASMKAGSASGTRFDMARKEAIRLIDALPKESRLLLIEAGNSPVIRSGFSADRRRLKEIIRDIRPSDTPGRLEKALYLALSFLDPDRDDWISFITDGADHDFKRLIGLNSRIRPVLIKGGSRNIGITAFDVRPETASPGEYEIMLEVKNFNPGPVICPIRVTIGKETIYKETIGLKGREKKIIIIPRSAPLRGLAQVTLEIIDDFPVDNRALAVLDPDKEVRVLLVSKGNYFLEKILEVQPRFRIDTLKEITPSTWDNLIRQYDIIILDRISPPHTEQGNFLLIDSFSPSLPVSETGTIKGPVVLDWDSGHPLTAGLDMRDVHIEKAALVKAETLRPLIESSQTGLMYAYEKGGLRAVFLGFDPERSDLPLRFAFPVMMGNIFRWLHPEKLNFSTRQSKAGEPYSIYLEPGTKTFSITRPSGQEEEHNLTDSPFLYSDTREAGLYAVKEGEKYSLFAVNLLDESESDILAPTLNAQGAGAMPGSGSEMMRAEFPLWIVLLLLASITMAVEWIVWFKNP